MNTNEHRVQALKFLSDSDRKFEAGDFLQASEKLWGAASHALMYIIGENGWSSGTHRTLRMAAERLSVERDDPLIAAWFSIAEKFHSNFYHGSMESFELEGDRPLVRRLVERVLNGESLPASGS